MNKAKDIAFAFCMALVTCCLLFIIYKIFEIDGKKVAFFTGWMSCYVYCQCLKYK